VPLKSCWELVNAANDLPPTSPTYLARGGLRRQLMQPGNALCLPARRIRPTKAASRCRLVLQGPIEITAPRADHFESTRIASTSAKRVRILLPVRHERSDIGMMIIANYRRSCELWFRTKPEVPKAHAEPPRIARAGICRGEKTYQPTENPLMRRVAGC
jgi:hypothetical protein